MRAGPDRFLHIVLKLFERYNIQNIQAYAPTSFADDKTIEKFHKNITIAKKIENTVLYGFVLR